MTWKMGKDMRSQKKNRQALLSWTHKTHRHWTHRHWTHRHWTTSAAEGDDIFINVFRWRFVVKRWSATSLNLKGSREGIGEAVQEKSRAPVWKLPSPLSPCPALDWRVCWSRAGDEAWAPEPSLISTPVAQGSSVPASGPLNQRAGWLDKHWLAKT